MPDTLPKFGGDCKCSFRDLGLRKILIAQKRRFLNKFPARNPIFIHLSRAKVGGAVSTVNNKFYKGGQVMPKEIVQEIDLNKISYAVL